MHITTPEKTNLCIQNGFGDGALLTVEGLRASATQISAWLSKDKGVGYGLVIVVLGLQ